MVWICRMSIGHVLSWPRDLLRTWPQQDEDGSRPENGWTFCRTGWSWSIPHTVSVIPSVNLSLCSRPFRESSFSHFSPISPISPIPNSVASFQKIPSIFSSESWTLNGMYEKGALTAIVRRLGRHYPRPSTLRKIFVAPTHKSSHRVFATSGYPSYPTRFASMTGNPPVIRLTQADFHSGISRATRGLPCRKRTLVFCCLSENQHHFSLRLLVHSCCPFSLLCSQTAGLDSSRK